MTQPSRTSNGFSFPLCLSLGLCWLIGRWLGGKAVSGFLSDPANFPLGSDKQLKCRKEELRGTSFLPLQKHPLWLVRHRFSESPPKPIFFFCAGRSHDVPLSTFRSLYRGPIVYDGPCHGWDWTKQFPVQGAVFLRMVPLKRGRFGPCPFVTMSSLAVR